MGQLAFQVVQQVFLRLFYGEGGNFLQHVKLAFFHGLGFLQTFLGLLVLLIDLVLFALHVLELFFQTLLFLQNPAFLVLNLFAPVGQFL